MPTGRAGRRRCSLLGGEQQQRKGVLNATRPRKGVVVAWGQRWAEPHEAAGRMLSAEGLAVRRRQLLLLQLQVRPARMLTATRKPSLPSQRARALQLVSNAGQGALSGMPRSPISKNKLLSVSHRLLQHTKYGEHDCQAPPGRREGHTRTTNWGAYRR